MNTSIELILVIFAFLYGLVVFVQKPNIIFILADDLGYGDVSSYNENSKIQTTNIDKLAAEAIIFTDARTSSAVCTPIRYGHFAVPLLCVVPVATTLGIPLWKQMVVHRQVYSN